MHIKSLLCEYIPVFVKGVLMGICDSIPGVSGGTIAFITGIYFRLINAIAHISPHMVQALVRWDLVALKRHLKEMDISFLVVLTAGIGIEFILASNIILFLLSDYPVQTNGFFLGLILASSVVLFAPLPHRYRGAFIFLVLGIIVGLAIVMAHPQSLGHSYPVLFITGFLALCAMILPGISGAYITLILNQYEFMLHAIRSLSVPDIAAYLAGGILGILIFTRFLKYLIQHYHDPLVAFLTGLMLGTSKMLYDRTTDALPPGPELVICVIVGILVIGLFHLVQRSMHTD